MPVKKKKLAVKRPSAKRKPSAFKKTSCSGPKKESPVKRKRKTRDTGPLSQKDEVD